MGYLRERNKTKKICISARNKFSATADGIEKYTKRKYVYFLEINIVRVAFFYFLLQIKVKTFFENILFKSEYFAQF